MLAISCASLFNSGYSRCDRRCRLQFFDLGIKRDEVIGHISWCVGRHWRREAGGQQRAGNGVAKGPDEAGWGRQRAALGAPWALWQWQAQQIRLM
jgi:hypothetical protein